ncbi:MAG TPA: pseudaminic acid synthase, partial [Polyangiaceae bacterium]|nr:pseudaminic acid synthase [Polyangiaceae bacterium]
VSNNHLGDPERACRLIEVAAKAGADAVKIQTFDADSLTIDSDRPEFMIRTQPWAGLNYYQLYRKIALPAAFTERLFKVARDCGITIFSSPFDERAVALLQELNCPAYKIASFEVCDDPLLKVVAATGRPVLVSTGVANVADIEETLRVLRQAGSGDIGLFHCVSEYPARIRDMNLRALDRLALFGCEVGLSDHSLSHLAATLAVARGAVLIEKHFTLARSDGGPDASFSLEPDELAGLVKAVNEAWEALGDANILTRPSRPGSEHARSLFIVHPVAAGEVIGPEHVRAIRPGLGLPPRSLSAVLGRRARRDLPRGEPLKWGDLE